ncbi:MAG: NADP-dependent phosphogluconate dehydrogenase, partial [Bryobacterales bacterium]|nr:NADP-dependent phosphogluconate dehydrogenase [Bryobacterales bacterium]
IIIDGGNSLFEDTARRTRQVEHHGLLYVGTGVSGGELGARHGPSLMPGGSAAAWPHVKPLLQAIAAKVDGGTPCCDWVGSGGAGHYEVFRDWNGGELESYLIEITRDILATRDADGQPLLDKVLDAAGQKGTGKWTVISSQDLGTPVTLIAEAVYARFVSAMKAERLRAAGVFAAPAARLRGQRQRWIDDIRRALYAAKIVSYAQGYLLLRAAARHQGWALDYGGIALMWRG